MKFEVKFRPFTILMLILLPNFALLCFSYNILPEVRGAKEGLDYIGYIGADFNTIRNPTAIAILASGNIATCDLNSNLIHITSNTGNFLSKFEAINSTLSPLFSTLSDERAVLGMSTNTTGYLFVLDAYRQVSVFSPSGVYLYKWDLNWTSSGYPFFALNSPSSIAIDDSNNVFVRYIDDPFVQKFSFSGKLLEELNLTYSQNYGKFSLAVNSSGFIYTTHDFFNRIQVFNSTGSLSFEWGASGPENGNFSSPGALAINNSGYTYVADTGNYRIQCFYPNGTFLCAWGSEGSADGQFEKIEGIAISPSGALYVADSENGRVQVFSSTGQFLRKWGNSGIEMERLNGPCQIRTNETGYIYLLETGNHIRVYNPERSLALSWDIDPSISPYAFNINSSGYVYILGDNLSATSDLCMIIFTATGQVVYSWDLANTGIGACQDFAINGSGEIFLMDIVVGKIWVYSCSGHLQYSWDVIYPTGIAINERGEVYIAASRFKKIQVFTETGTLLFSFNMNGTGRLLYPFPISIVFYESDYVFVTDQDLHQIKAFTMRGEFIGKWGSWGYQEGQFIMPASLAVDHIGQILVVEYGGNRVQIFAYIGPSFDPILLTVILAVPLGVSIPILFIAIKKWRKNKSMPAETPETDSLFEE